MSVLIAEEATDDEVRAINRAQDEMRFWAYVAQMVKERNDSMKEDCLIFQSEPFIELSDGTRIYGID